MDYKICDLCLSILNKVESGLDVVGNYGCLKKNCIIYNMYLTGLSGKDKSRILFKKNKVSNPVIFINLDPDEMEKLVDYYSNLYEYKLYSVNNTEVIKFINKLLDRSDYLNYLD